MSCVVNDEDSSVVAVIGAVGMCWVAKSMPATDFKILAHRLVFLLVQMGLHQHIDLVVPGPLPVKGALSKSSDVANIQPHLFLCEPGLFGRCAVEWCSGGGKAGAICRGVTRAEVWMPQTCTIWPAICGVKKSNTLGVAPSSAIHMRSLYTKMV